MSLDKKLLSWGWKLGFIFLLMLMSLAETSFAQQSSQAETEDSNVQPAPPAEVLFIPPANGAPAGRVGAATRDIAQDGQIVTLLAPEGGGITTLGSPPLVWYLSASFAGKMRAQIAPVGAPEAGVMKTVESRFRKGFYALDLSRSDFALQPGTIYEWQVVLSDRSSGNVQHRETTFVEGTTDGWANSPSDVSALAAAGLWFDALAHFVDIGLSGRVQIEDEGTFRKFISSAGVKID